MNDEFRSRAMLGVGLAAALLLAPFSVNHLRQGRILLGIGTLAIVVVLAVVAWLGSRGRSHPWVGFAGLTPVVLVILWFAFIQQGIIGALWAYPATLAFYFTLQERQAWVSNAALLVLVSVSAWNVLEQEVAIRVAATLFGTSVFSGIFVRIIARQRASLEQRAVTDPLTGLHNRALLPSTLRQAVEQAHRSGVPMTLLALDLDSFKGVNDTYGHDVGDQVLVGTAEILRDRIRKSDVAFRSGGEEFLTLLFGTDVEQARRVAEDLRRAIEAREMVPGQSVTVSIGVAQVEDGENWEGWLKRSDQYLYTAKETGRNRVVA